MIVTQGGAPVAAHGGNLDPADPDLALVVARWPTLSGAIRKAIVAMVHRRRR